MRPDKGADWLAFTLRVAAAWRVHLVCLLAAAVLVEVVLSWVFGRVFDALLGGPVALNALLGLYAVAVLDFPRVALLAIAVAALWQARRVRRPARANKQTWHPAVRRAAAWGALAWTLLVHIASWPRALEGHPYSVYATALAAALPFIAVVAAAWTMATGTALTGRY